MLSSPRARVSSTLRDWHECLLAQYVSTPTYARMRVLYTSPSDPLTPFK